MAGRCLGQLPIQVGRPALRARRAVRRASGAAEVAFQATDGLRLHRVRALLRGPRRRLGGLLRVEIGHLPM